jgi:indolepyruvate ferredoxin oxidoreductase, beta subunit
VSERPLKLTIAALGGQGGGVLADWLIEIAEAEGHLVQSTSVPGVAQRTGATIYYLEFFARDAARRAGREPVMALMPVPGDVDCVLASELAEAGRMVQRGLVNPERTTLIASTHRSYAIGEKSAMGRGEVDSQQLLELLRTQAKRLILLDMAELAERHDSVISSVLLGALCGSGVLPFKQARFEAAIEHSGIAVAANLAAFRDASAQAAARAAGAAGGAIALGGSGAVGAAVGAPDSAAGAAARSGLGALPERARSPALQPLLDRIWKLPSAAQSLAFEGTRRLIDYQDPAYAALYLDRLERVAALDSAAGPSADRSLVAATARSLALWMSFEDTIRVADLKSRAARFERVRAEVRAAPEQLVGITEFFSPRVAEVAGTLPRGLGRWLLASPRMCGVLARLTGGKRVRANTVSGFVLLYALAGLKRWRRGTLRYEEENARIEQWLGHIERLAVEHYELALEVSRSQRLVKGYGDTLERGFRNYTALMNQLDLLAARADGALQLARLQQAALADEEGSQLAGALAELGRVHTPGA